MRLSEALGLRWGDLTMTASDSLIKLHRIKKLKTGRARTIPMTDTCRSILETAKRREVHPNGPFADLNKRRAQHIWSRAVRDARIDDPECVIHCLRHTCATRLLRATGNLVLVRDWLGHTTIQTTADIYAHIESESMLLGATALAARRSAHQEAAGQTA
jgi:integrase